MAKNKRHENELKKLEAAAASLKPLDDLIDYDKVAVMWPQWDERDLETELWNANDVPQAQPKNKVKTLSHHHWPYEDPSGPVILPPSLQHLAVQQKRPHELFPSVDGQVGCHVVAPDRFEKQRVDQLATDEELQFARMRNYTIKEEFQEPEISLVTSNYHLLTSELMRWLITHLTFQQQEPMPWDMHVSRPWELIYPQTRDGRPVYNPGGKYAVKLFWLGTWRKVLVDDLLPMDARGRLLLPASSRPNELWPLILCKAVCRIASLCYVQAVGAPDYGDANLLQMLTGWVTSPHAVSMDPRHLIDMLVRRCGVPPSTVHYVSIDPDTHQEFEVLLGASSHERASTPTAMKKRAVSGTPTTQRSDSLARIMVGVLDSAKRAKSGLEAEPNGDGAATNRNSMVYAYYGADSPVSHTDVGLPGRLSHPIRVLSCNNISPTTDQVDMKTEEYYNVDNWILELQSPLVLYTGPGGHNSMFPHWKKIQSALGVSFEREHAMQSRSLKLRGEGLPFQPFRFRMSLKAFLALFKNLIVLQRETEFQFRSTILGSKDMPPTIIHEAGYQQQQQQQQQQNQRDSRANTDPEAKPVDLSHGRPWLLHNHSESSVDLIVCFCVAQPYMPHFGVRGREPRPPEAGTLEFELFQWQSPANGKVALRVTTSGTSTVLLRLKPGRNVFHVLTHVPATFSLTIMATKEFSIGDELHTLRQMGSCSSRFVNHAFGVIKAVKVIIGKEPGEATEFIRSLARMHSSDMNIPVEGMIVFWRAMVSSLETFLNEKWYEPIEDDPAFTVGQAWTMICGDILKELVAAFGKVTQTRAFARTLNQRGKETAANSTRRKRMPRLKAAITIQRVYRGHLGRLLAHACRQERILRFRGIILQSWETVGGSMIEFTMMLFRRIYDISPETINLFPFAKDESLRCTVKDFHARTVEHEAGDWFILSQDVIHLTETTTLATRLHVPVDETRSLNSSFQLHIVDNDSGEEIPTLFNEPLPCSLKVNRRGYTLYVDGRCSVGLPALSWGVRMISNPELPTDPAKGGLAALTQNIPFKEFSGPMRLRKDGHLFKLRLSTTHTQQLIALHLSVKGAQSSDIVFTLEAYRGESVLYHNTGTMSVQLPVVFLSTMDERRRSSTFVSEPTAIIEEQFEMLIVARAKATGSGSALAKSDADDFSRQTSSPGPGRVSSANELSLSVGKAGRPGKSARGGKKNSASDRDLPQWVLRLFAKDPSLIEVATDAQREEEINGLKSMWEVLQPGRKNKGERLRTHFMSKSSSALLPALTSSSQSAPNLLSHSAQRAVAHGRTGGQGDLSPFTSPLKEEHEVDGNHDAAEEPGSPGKRHVPLKASSSAGAIMLPPRTLPMLVSRTSPQSQPQPLSPAGIAAELLGVLSSPDSPPYFLDEEVKRQRDQSREVDIELFQQLRRQAAAHRETDKQARLMALLNHKLQFLGVQSSRSALQADVLGRREEIKRRITEAIEAHLRSKAEAEALAAAAAAAAASPPTRGSESRQKAKAGGKK